MIHPARDFAERSETSTIPRDPARCSGILQARGLGRRRDDGEGWLLRDVHAEVRPGDRVAVTGPSGAGKSLLLRALARLDPIDEGELLWDGCAVQGDVTPLFRSRVIYLHQRPALFEGTVEDNLRLPLALRAHRGRRFDRDRAVALLGSLGRDGPFLEKSHGDLSGGEGQIVALLRTLPLEPAILLLDEPTASLDREVSRAIEGLVDRWHAAAPGARAVLWVTHDLEQAVRVADRRWSMHSGQLATET